MLKIALRVTCLAGVGLLAACSGGDGTPASAPVLTTPTAPPSPAPAAPAPAPAPAPVPVPAPIPPPAPAPVDPLAPKDLTDITLFDAARTPLSDADVLVEDDPGTATATAAKASQMVKTDSKGVAKVKLQSALNYFFTISKKTGSVKIKVKIGNQNTASNSTLIAPLSCGDDSSTSCTNVSMQAIIGSVAGTVVCDGKLAKGAQVALSGGAATNGRYATAITNDEGQYALLYNVNRQLESALKSSTFSASAEGCDERVISNFEVIGENLYGQNFELAKTAPSTTPPSASVLFRETFETDSTTVANWVVAGGFTPSNTAILPTTWQLISTGHGLVNTLVPTFSSLPPDDSSNAAVPNPIEGTRTYWYGGRSSGSFIGEQIEGDEPLDGGNSTDQHEGTLTSPPINLSSVAASTDVSLTFKTWWEIEAVNPNQSGFDLMTVEVSTDGGQTFKPIARLNPLSDPVTEGTDRDPLAYTTTGFNAAAIWVEQERIPLLDVQGKADVRIRFNFGTVDGLFNGFRGWLVDDVLIAPVKGTFPLFGGGQDTSSESPAASEKRAGGYSYAEWGVPTRSQHR